jgi:hypothetical protein
MRLRVTVDVFSGRPNPVIELSGRQTQEALEQLKPARRLGKREIARLPGSTLGYRGLIVEQIGRPAKGLPKLFRYADGDLFGPRLSHRASDDAFEDFIFGSTGPLKKLRPGKRFLDQLKRERDRFRRVRQRYVWKPPLWPFKKRCACAPLYEPNWWNDGGQRQWNNNCYNYACNYRTDTFAQPGLAAGAMYTSLTCAAVRPAAVADDLIDKPGAKNKCPGEGHLVALVVAPGWDFHWYRKGRNGFWTHKPGGTPVTNQDNSGHSIPDPRSADRGPYTDFCTFMVVMHGHIKIQ